MSRREHYLAENAFVYNRQPAPPTENDFPTFTDGDVFIIITGARRYKLHSSVLRRGSAVFADLLAEGAAVKLASAAVKKGVTTKYRLQLVANPAHDPSLYDSPEHLLKRAVLDHNGRPTGNTVQTLGDANENGRPVPHFVLVSMHSGVQWHSLTMSGLGANARRVLQ